MKKKVFLSFLLLALLANFALGLELNEAIEMAGKARRIAMDYNCHKYFPSEWEAIEKHRDYAEAIPASNDNENTEKTEALFAVAEAYDALHGKSAPLYAQAREDEIMEVRDTLMEINAISDYTGHLRIADDIALRALYQYEAGDYDGAKESADAALEQYHMFLLAARTYEARMDIENIEYEEYNIDDDIIDSCFEYLAATDAVALRAIDQYEAGDYDGARDSANYALSEYNLFRLAAWTFGIRLEIADRGFEGYDPNSLNNTDAIALAALDDYYAGDKEAARAKVLEAELLYSLILNNSWIRYASERERSATNERERALANKVNIAVRESFRDADVVYFQAADDYKVEKYQNAAILFTEAEARFAVAGRETEEKRQRAADTIRMADEKITAVERSFEGGSR